MPSIDVLDSTMFYEEAGTGAPLVFLHGNPVSSYEWRKVLARMGEPGRLLAPDLIGMGRSGRPDRPYRFADHARYLDAWFDELTLEGLVLVGRDWGGVLAFDWASRHPDRVRGVAFMETMVRPLSGASFPDRHPFWAIRTPGIGETMVLDENFFFEQAIHRTTLSALSEQDVEAYREPYPTRDSRRPLLQWARSMPIDGEPADVVHRIEAFHPWLASSEDVPKLLLTFDSSPTLVIEEETVAWCAANIANLEIERCGAAGHLATEDQPEAIAAAITSWADRHRLR